MCIKNMKNSIVLLLIIFISGHSFAAEKPEIFVQMAKESTIYFGGLKFTQEVQT